MVSFKIHHANKTTTEGFRSSFSKDRREVNSKDINDICDSIAEDIAKKYHQHVASENVLITSMFYMGEMTEAEFYQEPEGEE